MPFINQLNFSFIKSSLLVIAAVGLIGCEKPQRTKPQVEVVVANIEQFPYQTRNTFVGHLTAANDVEIEARVKAKILKVNFKQGAKVNAGDVLFELDDSELQAQYKQAQAEVSKAQSALNISLKNYNRGKELIADDFISKSEIDTLEGKYDEAKSQLKAVQAKQETAAVNLAYTTIEAPLDGTIDRSKFSVGDVVSPESGDLTTIVAVNTMEVPFQVSEKLYWKMARKFQKQGGMGEDSKPEVEIAFGPDDVYEHQGMISFVSNRVDPETGSMEVRAVVPNPDGILKPGQYVSVILKSPKAVDTIMIPQSAVQSDQQGDFAMTIVDNTTVVRNNIKLGDRVGTNVIVLDGLTIDQVLVISGVQKIREGQQVKIKQNKPAASIVTSSTSNSSTSNTATNSSLGE